MESNKINRKPGDAQTQKRIHEHLADKKDIITEDDIKNAKADITEMEQQPTAVQKKNDEDPEDKKVKDNTNPGIQTTWNILES
jgi:polyhydroxyalkanoate synthesis regulator phasin